MPTSIVLAQPWEGHAPDTLLDVSNDRAIQLVADGWARRAGDPRPEPVGFADTIVLKAAPMSYEDAARADAQEDPEPTVAELKATIDRRNAGREDATRISKGGSKADLIAALDADDAAQEAAAASAAALDSVEAENAGTAG